MPTKQWEREHRAERREYLRNWRKLHPDQVRAQKRSYAKRHRKQVNARARRYQQTLRKQIFAAYGNKCELCRSTENLTIDHINGDGSEHRKRKAFLQIWVEIRQQGFPKDRYRLLCRSCNTKEWYRLHWKGSRTCPKCGHKF